MITPATRGMIEGLSIIAEGMFKRHGMIRPIYYVVHPDERMDAIEAPPFGTKDEAVALMRAYFEIHKIKRYVFVDEAWILDSTAAGLSSDEAKKAFDYCNKHGVEAHPSRQEAVIFFGEDEQGQQNARRKIERPAKGKSRLGPLIFDPVEGTLEGRFIGMLPRVGAVQ